MPTLGTSVPSTLDAWAYTDRVSATDARYALAAYAMPIAEQTNISYRGGVYASGDSHGVGGSTHLGMRVTPGSGLAVKVAMGNCIIDTPSNGPYTCALDSEKTISLAAASSTQNRYDLVIARVYDDLNTAIASPAGTRKFVVEVWTGDGSTSASPNQPVPTPTAGWIPLALVYVGKGANSLTSANITDKRGPGLVARGGMRLLAGDDAKPDSAAFAEPGAYPGDQRYVHGPGFQHQVYAGSNSDPLQSGWHGVHNAMFYEKEVSSDFTVLNVGSGATLVELTVPYPGTPFRIKPAGRVFVAECASNCSVDLFLNCGASGANLVNWTNADTYRDKTGWEALWSFPMECSAMAYGIFNDDLKVQMRVGLRDARASSGFKVRAADGWYNLLQVEVIPAPAHNVV